MVAKTLFILFLLHMCGLLYCVTVGWCRECRVAQRFWFFCSVCYLLRTAHFINVSVTIRTFIARSQMLCWTSLSVVSSIKLTETCIQAVTTLLTFGLWATTNRCLFHLLAKKFTKSDTHSQCSTGLPVVTTSTFTTTWWFLCMQPFIVIHRSSKNLIASISSCQLSKQ